MDMGNFSKRFGLGRSAVVTGFLVFPSLLVEGDNGVGVEVMTKGDMCSKELDALSSTFDQQTGENMDF